MTGAASTGTATYEKTVIGFFNLLQGDFAACTIMYSSLNRRNAASIPIPLRLAVVSFIALFYLTVVPFRL